MREPGKWHTPVCERLLVDGLKIQPPGVYVDGTVGMGGHSLAIASRLNEQGTFIGLDRDPCAIEIARERLAGVACRVFLVQANAANLANVLSTLGQTQIDGCAFDWGISSWQLEHSGRGFSYRRAEPLDMRMDPSQALTAASIVNTWEADSLLDILRSYGEEYRWARSIVRTILKARPLNTAEELAEVIRQAVPYRSAGHPARRTFQALRIAVNEEMSSVHSALRAALGHLRFGGRLVSLAFHSLEDRIVKKFFANEARRCICPPKFPVCTCHHKPTVHILTPRPLRAPDTEIRANPRARSALLRIASRL
ncbi:16S rRNA (cytosine(1402)-N(4))-methyltransferase RsmH [Pasteuria penetrans]|uniref:16S rRNA (cytosine(1402)-N(4))-methyltransferase RsmH n=1 Tax=Pasteuria penetrans TaxID=86005 RepID=UPI0011EE5EBC|nr:16S rRNA (cytosine(1402)-N(4))-methyltransferase RsmH [Pasteuria penetrans]